MIFDLPSFINIVLSAIIGVITSWLIAHWYYRKNGPIQRILAEIKSVLPSYFHPVILPQFYSAEAVTVLPSQPVPTDLDIPHVELAILSKNRIVDGDRVEVLLKVRDMGRNLENPTGIRLRDHLERDVAVRFVGLGFAAAAFSANRSDAGAHFHLTVVLQDTIGNQNTQSIPFLIHPR